MGLPEGWRARNFAFFFSLRRCFSFFLPSLVSRDVSHVGSMTLHEREREGSEREALLSETPLRPFNPFSPPLSPFQHQSFLGRGGGQREGWSPDGVGARKERPLEVGERWEALRAGHTHTPKGVCQNPVAGRVGPKGWGGPKCSLLLPFSLFLPLGIFFVEFGGVLKRWDVQMCTSQTCTQGPGASKHHQSSTKRHPREGRKSEHKCERKKK